eukprot:TRINITY_DN276_c0_g6_i1.p1 TRINITY_DN276_c0_g6~~TRINITY_DN276_c0_g6_i1.p1  ORF type:complete len:212 (-),score=28.42 TRINITY_DN276_c0_g6_i1:119-754(-)
MKLFEQFSRLAENKMRNLITLSVCALLVIYVAGLSTDETQIQRSVQDLDKDNFDIYVNNATEEKWMVEFYAPWCGHCKKLKPIWAELGTTATNFYVGRVDCTSESSICRRFGVSAYPAIKLIENGFVYNYKGARTLENFIEFGESGFKDVDKQVFPQLGDNTTRGFRGAFGEWVLRYKWVFVVITLGVVLFPIIFFYNEATGGLRPNIKKK